MKEGRNSIAFKTVREQLKGFKANNARLTFVYTLVQQGRLDPVHRPPVDQPEGPKFMQLYDTAPNELKVPVTEPIGLDPYTDQWGTFVSGFAPVNTGSNATVMVLGVDIPVV